MKKSMVLLLWSNLLYACQEDLVRTTEIEAAIKLRDTETVIRLIKYPMTDFTKQQYLNLAKKMTHDSKKKRTFFGSILFLLSVPSIYYGLDQFKTAYVIYLAKGEKFHNALHPSFFRGLLLTAGGLHMLGEVYNYYFNNEELDMSVEIEKALEEVVPSDINASILA